MIHSVFAADAGATAGGVDLGVNTLIAATDDPDGGFADVFAGIEPPPLAIGANCGVGAADILVTLLAMAERNGVRHLISKGNCGVPRFRGSDIVYSGTPDLMAEYARLAVDAGAAIVGGCCGTTPDHIRAIAATVAGLPPRLARPVEFLLSLSAARSMLRCP